MNYTLIDRQEVPTRGPERSKRRIPGVDELVASLEAGKVARIELSEDERPRLVTEQLYKTATRAGKLIDVWEADGVLYAELASSAAP